MKRLSYLLGLLALVVLVVFVRHVDGITAILFSFVGMPALGLAIGIHLIHRWHAGAFALTQAPIDPQQGH